MSRDLRREALRLWTAPFWAALSNETMACIVAISAASTSPESIEMRALRTRVFALERIGRILCPFRSATRCDFAAGTCFGLPWITCVQGT